MTELDINAELKEKRKQLNELMAEIGRLARKKRKLERRRH